MAKVNLDKVGICASTVCAVHCVLTGLAFGLLAVAGLEILADPVVEGILFTVAILVGSFAVRHGYKTHKSWVPAAIFATGIGAIIVAHFVIAGPAGHDHDHGATSSFWTTALSVGGGLLIVGFHIANQLFLRRRKATCACPTCDPTESNIRKVRRQVDPTRVD